MYNNKKNKLILSSTIGLLLSGCASISSQVVCTKNKMANTKACEAEKPAFGDGITYYLPRRDIRLHVSIAPSKKDVSTSGSSDKTTATISTAVNQPIDLSIGAANPKTPAPDPAPTAPKTVPLSVTITLVNNYLSETIPDPDNIFLLRYNKNYIGENNMAVGVNSYGLLTVTHADTINKINEIAKNIGADIAIATIGAGTATAPTDQPATRAKALETFSFENKKPGSIAPSADVSYKFSADSDTPNCNERGEEYDLVFNPKDSINSATVCGKTITVEPIFEQQANLKSSYRIDPEDDGWDSFYNLLTEAKGFLDVTHLHNKHNTLPGLFYKQDLPYWVKITESGKIEQKCSRVNALEAGNESNKESADTRCTADDFKCADGTDIKTDKNGLKYCASRSPKIYFHALALSPNESKIFFAPITETLFTDNTSDITLINGVVNQLAENTDSELLALTKMPASVMSGYTSALGNVFSNLNTVYTNQGQAQTSQMGVLLGAQKLARCQMAIDINRALFANKSEEDQATALNNIQSACGGQ